MTSDPLAALVADLGRATERARVEAGTAPVGVRAIEPAAGARWYMCAFAGPRFLCLTADLQVERDGRRARQAAACALLVEHVEELIDPGELDVMAAAASGLATHVEARDLHDALTGIEQATRALSAWRSAPERAVASLPELEAGIRLHDEVRRHYERFVERSEPLVAIQERLADELIAALRDVEEAAGRTGIMQALPMVVAQSMEALDAGALEMLQAHLSPLSRDAP